MRVGNFENEDSGEPRPFVPHGPCFLIRQGWTLQSSACPSRITSTGGQAASRTQNQTYRDRLLAPGDLDPALLGDAFRFLISRVRVADDARGRVGGEHSFQADSGFSGAVGNDNVADVGGVANADAVIRGYPRRPKVGVNQGLKYGPVEDGVLSRPSPSPWRGL